MSHILHGKQNKAHGTIQEYFKMSHQPTKTFHTYEIIELRKRKLRLKVKNKNCIPDLKPFYTSRVQIFLMWSIIVVS